MVIQAEKSKIGEKTEQKFSHTVYLYGERLTADFQTNQPKKVTQQFHKLGTYEVEEPDGTLTLLNFKNFLAMEIKKNARHE